jgi:hypothetical protein
MNKFILIFIVIFFSGCASYTPLEIDSRTGYFPEDKKLANENILHSEASKSFHNYRSLNLTTKYGEQWGETTKTKIDNLIIDSLSKIGFRNIVLNSPLEQNKTEIA